MLHGTLSNVDDADDGFMMSGAIQCVDAATALSSSEDDTQTQLQQAKAARQRTIAATQELADSTDSLRRESAEPNCEEPLQDQDDPHMSAVTSPSLEETKALMLGRGWCHHQIEYLAQVHELSVLHAFAKLDRRILRPEDHRPCLQTNHCIAYNVPADEIYQTKHAKTCSDSGCYMVKTPQRDLVRIVESGGVPVVSIHEDRDGRLSLRVHRRRFRTRYFTISHVWADGLGNPFENAIPACQVNELQSAVRMMSKRDVPIDHSGARVAQRFVLGNKGPRLLWMDTLCIPVGRELLHLRLRCIDAMSSIYAGSESVVIFDKELMGTPLPAEPTTNSCSDLAPLYQIAASVWMCRSWTLQEAVLPLGCIFRYEDGYFCPDRNRYAPTAVGTTENSTLNNESRQQEIEQYAIARFLFDQCLEARNREDVSPTENFVFTWNSLAGRSTTKAEDLYVVLASCLNFKLYQLRQFKSIEEKMQHMIFSFRILPLSLFFNAGPRLNAGLDHYNRWVPTEVSKCLLEAGSTFSFPDPDISIHCDQGTFLSLDLQEETVLLLEHPIALFSGTTLVTERCTFRITPVLAQDEQLRTSIYEGTIFILSQAPHSNTWRGACFYILSTSQRSHQDSSSGPDFQMVYRCPVTAIPDIEPTDFQHNARLLDSACNFYVKFTPIPNFRPLKKKSRQRPYSGAIGLSISLP